MMRTHPNRPLPHWFSAFAILMLLGPSVACTRLVVNSVGSALNNQGTAFAAEDDPELVREAIPFGLKTIESLLEASPKNDEILLAATSGFTQYAYAFVLQDAQIAEDSQPELAKEKMARARRLFQRAWRYGFRGLEARHKGFGETFAKDRPAALSTFKKSDVPLAYWTAAALAAQISISKDDMNLIGRLPEVEALMSKALELDESWNDGAIHEFFATYEAARADAAADGLKRAKGHYDRVLLLTGERKLAPLVSWAEGVCVQKQDRKGFLERLDKVLAFDADSAPRFRLVNLVTQRRARWLKSRTADLFLED